ncbi:MAG: pilin [Candidatus Saccharimonadaceae bacterium]
MNKIKLLIATFAVAMFGVFALVPVASVSALDPLGDICTQNPDSEVCKSSSDSATDLIGKVINTLLFIVGSLSVIMIIVAGIFYVTSTGDSGKVSRAKNTLTYSIVGLVVAFLAYAIINWVVRLF